MTVVERRQRTVPAAVAAPGPGARPAPAVLVIDDHAVLRRGLCHVIAEAFPGAEIHEAATLRHGIELAGAVPDLSAVVYDLHLPDADGIEGLEALQAALGRLPVIVFSGDCEATVGTECIRSGARAFVPKSCDAEVVGTTLALVLGTDEYLALPRAVMAPAPAEAAGAAERQLLERLTGRERDVLLLLAQGLSNKQIARALGLLEGTVKVHARAVMQKLGAGNRTQAAIVAARVARTL